MKHWILSLEPGDKDYGNFATFIHNMFSVAFHWTLKRPPFRRISTKQRFGEMCKSSEVYDHWACIFCGNLISLLVN